MHISMLKSQIWFQYEFNSLILLLLLFSCLSRFIGICKSGRLLCNFQTRNNVVFFITPREKWFGMFGILISNELEFLKYEITGMPGHVYNHPLKQSRNWETSFCTSWSDSIGICIATCNWIQNQTILRNRESYNN